MSTEIKSKSDHSRTPWNKGRLIGQKRPLRPKEVWAIRVRLQIKRHKRGLAMFNLAIDSKLRGCDLVSLRVDDIAVGPQVRDRAAIVQHKTGRPVQFEITEQTRAPLEDWLKTRPADRGCRDGQQRVWHALDAPHHGGANLPQDVQSASSSTASRAYEDREHRPLPWDRSR
jgi:integrase